MLRSAKSDHIEPREDPRVWQEHAERYRALIDNVNEIIYSHDLQGNYTSINKAGERLTGYGVNEARQLNLAQVVAPEYQELVKRMINAKLAGEPSSFYEIEIITKDGHRLPLEVSTHLILSDGRPVGVQGVARDISERRKREAILIESEQRYKQLVNEATDIIYRTDLKGRFSFVNPIASKVLQRSRDELLGLHYLELIRKDYRVSADEFYRHQVREKIPATYFEFPTVARDGTEIWIGQNVQLLMRGGMPLELQAVARDITARKEVEDRLFESERRYRALFDASPHSICVYDVDTLEFLAVNEAAVRTYGYSHRELLSLTARDLWRAEEVPLLGGQTDSDGSRPRIWQHRRKDGITIQVEITSGPFTLGGRESVIVIATDVTERVRADAERQVMLDVIQSVNHTRDLDELLKFIHQSLKKVLYAENCFVALYDKATDSFEVPFFVDSSDSVCDPRQLKKSCAAYVFRSGEPILITPEVFERLVAEEEVELVGSPSPSWLGVPLKSPTETIGVLAVQHYEKEGAYTLNDLQFLASIGGQIALAIERKRAEEGLRLSEERFSKAFNFTPLAMSLTSLTDLRIIDVNNSFLALNGLERNRVIGKTAQDLNLWADSEEEVRFLQELKVKRSVRDQEIKVSGKDGSVRTYVISAEIINLRGEECILAVTNDITEHRALEEQLRQAQRMEAIGQLAGGVAHDFNNILTAITGYSQLSLRRLGIHHPVSKNIEQIQKAGTRAASLTRQLLAFSRRQMLQPRLLDLNVLVADMDNMLQRLIGEDIALQTMLKSEGEIKADPGQIEQVILNLVVNARDAMPKGGMITIETDNAELDRAYSRSHPPMVPGHYVLLAITDTGVGIDRVTQKRIFDPFFTTKDIGKGTGLGLSTVYGIVKQSEGYIWVYSEVGKGTTFKIYLPRVDQNADSEAAASAQAELIAGRETILLVEDEEQVRDLARAILEENGYTVVTAANGAEGLRLCEDFRGRFELVITDVVMPVMSGTELAQRMAPFQPQAEVLYMSGYTNDSMVRHGLLEDQVYFLEKPFAPNSLATKVREVLDQKSQP